MLTIEETERWLQTTLELLYWVEHRLQRDPENDYLRWWHQALLKDLDTLEQHYLDLLDPNYYVDGGVEDFDPMAY